VAIAGQHPGGARHEQRPNFNYFTLTGPNRLVIDLKGASNATNLARIENKSELVRKIRESTPLEKGGLRLVLDLGSAIKPVVFPLAPAGPYGHRLVIDLPYEEKGPRRSPRPSGQGKAIVIAIDPGHGGEDPGSIGPRRTYEKRVTLAVSQKLAALIDREPGMRAVLTRRGDYFVDLNKRSEIARKAKADLLVSVHADSFHNSTRAAPPSGCCRPTAPTARWAAGWRNRRSRASCWGRRQGVGRIRPEPLSGADLPRPLHGQVPCRGL
jgi:N-acetylmuramoyl-L-alanine amidase